MRIPIHCCSLAKGEAVSLFMDIFMKEQPSP